MATIKDTSTVARKDQDFSVYQRIDPRQRIDWGAQAKKITDTVDKIRDDRARRKAKIEKNYRKQQEKLQEMGDYESPDLQQTAIQAGRNLGSELADANQLLRQGLITENEYSMASHNIKSGAKLFKNLANDYDAIYKRSTERIQKNDSSQLERDLRNSALGFVNLDGIEVVADMSNNSGRSYGSVGLIRKDKNGTIIGDAQSLQNLSVKTTQEIDRFKLDELATEKAEEIGNYIVSEVITEGLTVQEWKNEYSRIKGDNDLMNKYLATMGNDTDYAGLLRGLAEQNDEFGKTPGGKKYETGTRAAHEALDAKLKKEGKSLDENNIIIFEPNKYGLYEAELSEEQKNRAYDFSREILLSKLDESETVKTKLMSFGGRGGNRPGSSKGELARRLVTVFETITPATDPVLIQEAEAEMNDMMLNPAYLSQYDTSSGKWRIIHPGENRTYIISASNGRQVPIDPTFANGGLKAETANPKSLAGFIAKGGVGISPTQFLMDDARAGNVFDRLNQLSIDATTAP